MSFVVTLGGSALGALGSGLTYIGASGLGATVSGLAAGTAGAGAAAGLASGMVGGAMLGAGIGQLTGGNTRSTLMGMGLGAGMGALAGLAAAPASASLATQSAATGAGAASGAASAAKSGFSLSSTLSNPLLLGAAGLGLASAFANTGQSFQDKIRLKPEGQALMYGTNKSGKPNNAPSKNDPILQILIKGQPILHQHDKTNNSGKDIEDMGGLVGATRKKWNAAAAGAIPEKAFEDISNLKQQEEERYGATKNAMHIAMTQMNNTNPINRGQAASGGALAKTALVSAGERMQGLFVPTSILNQYRREELANAAAAMQNIQNLENQTASITYQGSLSKWLGANMQQAQRGAAIGQALSLAGNFALNNAYLSRMNSITQNPANIIV